MKGIRIFQSIQMKLIIIYVLLILFAMQLIGIYFIKAMETWSVTNFSETLTSYSILIAGNVEPTLTEVQEGRSASGDGTKPYAELNNDLNNLSKVSNADIQVIDPNGFVVAASQQDGQSVIGQKNTQQVVTRALQNIKDKENELIMMDKDGNRKKILARPVNSNGKVVGAVYLSASMEEIYKTTNRINQIFLTGTVIALALTAVLGVILSGTITSPIKEITEQVTSVARGDYDRQVKVLAKDEIGQLSQAFNDMTNRLKEALSANEEEKEKLASVLANMSDGVIASDENDRVILINRRARQMLQLEETDSGKEADLFALLGLSREGTRRDADEELTKLIEIHPHGSEEGRKVRVTFTPIHRREIGTTGTIVVLQDVTEQEELEQSRREFVANVSHELRTPLTTIKSYLEALEDGALDDPQVARRFVGVTHNEAERMIRLVSDLLHLSRLDSKQASLKAEEVDVEEMLEEVADRFSFQLQQRSIAIGIRIGAGVEPILLDRDKIDQVLDNLISNAIKYTGDGGEIEISAEHSQPDWLEIAIQDTGIGIPKKDLSRIFERFYRVDKARSRNMGGTGLGLSIAREIVKAHGGTIDIESEYNEGTKVTFRLPYRKGGAVET
ncbi:PAS domain-containing sensor histidine kinase [Paenibacillus sp. J31TS4]|uniref:cell wall metabolism sensor histidine kinase WalK n=1 Tax=Paenibacillus sp. J31TS4 TaxID=2807195 RepID=UPI001B1A6FF1|nr:cell wall metabolism sensor histidine kinase WalK [Paenibacillus sp. J31TS4]GIP40606.1 PAS domain-containing sensor histidine kinase [Paenibacillus sp. J31TS4]